MLERISPFVGHIGRFVKALGHVSLFLCISLSLATSFAIFLPHRILQHWGQFDHSAIYRGSATAVNPKKGKEKKWIISTNSCCFSLATHPDLTRLGPPSYSISSFSILSSLLSTSCKHHHCHPTTLYLYQESKKTTPLLLII